MIAQIYKELHSRLKELTWMKHIALDTQQIENPEKNSPWNTPAVFISFDTQTVEYLNNNVYQNVVNVNFKFVMKDFHTHQLLCLEYSTMLEKKLHSFLGLTKVMNNFETNQDQNYVYTSIFQMTYQEDLSDCSDNIDTEIIGLELYLNNIQNFEDTDGQGFASTSGMIV